ncbi:hypothetical protein CRENBAI_017594 [Crenichthys baileyi]|uniref:Uncharacterized protein n=1 Tax=Crenichthys baileyi TaxID=28760 RepID=A0AAV9S428_9TELE
MGRIIPAYFTSRVPGLELARGPLSPNRWKWAEEGRSGGIGEEEEEEVEGRKSQSVLIKCCIEEDVPQQCVSSRGWSPSRSASRSDHLYCRLCHKVCAHTQGPGTWPNLEIPEDNTHQAWMQIQNL